MTAPSAEEHGQTPRRIRVKADLWDRFGTAVAADPEMNRSQVLRMFIRWYVGDTDELPRRPPRNGAADRADAAAR